MAKEIVNLCVVICDVIDKAEIVTSSNASFDSAAGVFNNAVKKSEERE